MNTHVNVSIKNSIDEIAALEPAWEELAHASGFRTPGSDPLWVRKWFEHIGTRSAPMVATVWEDGQLSGVLPMAVSERFLGMKLVTFAGAPHGALFDFPAEDDRREEVLEKVMSEIAARGDTWDICDLSDLSPDSICADVINEYADEFVFASDKLSGDPFLSIDLRCGNGDPKGSRKHRYNMRRARKKLAEIGSVDFKVVCDKNALERYMPQMFEIHRRRWKGYYTGSLFNSHNGRTFIEEIAKLYLERGSLYLALLTLDETAVAYALCFRFGDTLYYYNPAFDPEYATYSPGVILLEEIVKDCRDGGICRIELGKGSLPYKERLATSTANGKRIIFARRGPMASLFIHSYLAWLSIRDAARGSEVFRKMAGRLKEPSFAARKRA